MDQRNFPARMVASAFRYGKYAAAFRIVTTRPTRRTAICRQRLSVSTGNSSAAMGAAYELDGRATAATIAATLRTRTTAVPMIRIMVSCFGHLGEGAIKWEFIGLAIGGAIFGFVVLVVIATLVALACYGRRRNRAAQQELNNSVKSPNGAA